MGSTAIHNSPADRRHPDGSSLNARIDRARREPAGAASGLAANTPIQERKGP
jgi:hypothetical protein